jgi:hypothetical protein
VVSRNRSHLFDSLFFLYSLSLCMVAFSERDVQTTPVNVSTSLPLETVDEQNISIHKSMRLLKPIEGTDSWEQGRRYLIAPAALAACPLTVINKLSGGFVQSAAQAATAGTSRNTNAKKRAFFGTIELGEALITYVGDKHHLSLGKWSSCRLVLRQNYLMEYDPLPVCHEDFVICNMPWPTNMLTFRMC